MENIEEVYGIFSDKIQRNTATSFNFFKYLIGKLLSISFINNIYLRLCNIFSYFTSFSFFPNEKLKLKSYQIIKMAQNNLYLLYKKNYFGYFLLKVHQFKSYLGINDTIWNYFMNFLFYSFALIIPIYFFSYRWFKKFAPFIKKSHIYDEEVRNICIVGGGFGGLYTCLELAKNIKRKGRYHSGESKGRYSANIYLIDTKDCFVFSPLLYELAVDTCSNKEVAPKYEKLLKGYEDIVHFVQGRVDNIDLEKKLCFITPSEAYKEKMKTTTPIWRESVHIEETKESGPESDRKRAYLLDHELIRFDQLVISVGAKPNTDSVPGVKEHGFPFHTINDAHVLKNRIKHMLQVTENTKDEPINVHIVGAGYSGVELATNISERFSNRNCKVTLISNTENIISYAPPYNRKTSEYYLRKHNVDILPNSYVTRVLPNSFIVVSKDGEEREINSDLVIFTGGNCQSDLLNKINLPKSENGKILTKDTLQSIENDFVFSLGDCCKIEGQRNPSSAQVALQQSYVVAKNLEIQWNEYLEQEDFVDSTYDLNERLPTAPYKRFKFFDLGEMATLGDFTATITSMKGYFNISGFLASFIRRLVYSYRMPTNMQMLETMFLGSIKLITKKYREKFRPE